MKILFAKDSTKIRLLGLLIGCGMIFIQRSYGLGFLAGMMVSELYLGILNAFMTNAMAKQRYSMGSGTLVFVFRNFLLLIPFILTILYPAYINVFTAVIGLLYFKVCIYIKYLLFRDKENQ